MAYNETFSPSDIPDVVIDFVVSYGEVFVLLAGLLAIGVCVILFKFGFRPFRNPFWGRCK